LDTILVGILPGTNSLATTHAVEMRHCDNKPVRVCNETLGINLPDIITQDEVKLSSITCTNCYNSIKKRIRENKVIRNFTNSSSDFKYPVYDGKNLERMKEIIQFSKLYKKTCETKNGCRWDKGQHTCTYEPIDDAFHTAFHACTWERCLSIFTKLNYERKYKLDIFLKGVEKPKEDNTCEACFAEGDDKCEGCDEHNGYPNFVTEDEHNGTVEEEKEDTSSVQIGAERCGNCANILSTVFLWPCNACDESNNWQYFALAKKIKCGTCRFDNFSVDSEFRCDFYQDCDNNYSHWEQKEPPKEPKNGLVELPLGIERKVVFQHPEIKGQWHTLIDAVTQIRFDKLLKLITTLAEFEHENYDESYAGAIEQTLHTVACNINDEPTKYFGQFKEILEEMKP